MVKSTTSLFMFSKELRHMSEYTAKGRNIHNSAKKPSYNSRVENFFTEIKKNMNYMKKVTKT